MVFDCSTCSITCSKTICRLKTSSVNKEGCFTVFKLMYTEINIMTYKIPAKIHCQYQSITGKNLHENKRTYGLFRRHSTRQRSALLAQISSFGANIACKRMQK